MLVCGGDQSLIRRSPAWAILLILLFPRQADAIVDVSRAANETAAEGVSGRLSAGWQRRTGNTDRISGDGDFTGRYRAGDHLFLIILQSAYGEQSGDVYTDKDFFHGRYRLAFSDLLDGELFGQNARNKLLGYRERRLLGAGPRLKLIQSEELQLYTGLAWMLETEHLAADAVEEDGETRKQVQRLSLSVQYIHKISPALSVDLSAYYQPSLETSTDRRFTGAGSLRMHLTDALEFFSRVNASADTEPAAGREKTDMSMDNGLSLTF